MTEATADATTETTTDDTETDTAPDLQAEVDKWKATSRKHEDRAKANAAAAKELEQVRAESMSEQEKAVEAAKAEARLAAQGEFGGRLAAAEIKAAAAGRFDPEQLSTLVENLNLASFLGDDGEVDADKVSEFVNSIAPAKTDETEDGSDTERVLKTFDIGQGARGDQSLQGDAFTKALVEKVGGPRH